MATILLTGGTGFIGSHTAVELLNHDHDVVIVDNLYNSEASVVDLAKGHVAALAYSMAHSGCEVFNLGTGQGYSVLDLVRAFEEATGVKIPYEIVDRRPGDIAACYAATQKAEKLLGWQAEKSLSDMCRDSWRWQQSDWAKDGSV